MDQRADDAAEPATPQLDSPPDSVSPGSTVLVASTGVPTRYAVCLRILRRDGTAADTAFVVTTTESADRTIETYGGLEDSDDCPSLGIVDTISEQQSVAAIYDETPVVFTPSASDLERLVMALTELSTTISPSSGGRYLVVRSLTPILEAVSTTHVCRVLDRITGLRSKTGLCLLGLDYTAHDQETMKALATRADAVLWVTRTPSDRLKLEYQPTRHRHNNSMFSSE